MVAGDEADIRMRPHLEAGTWENEVAASDPRLPAMVQSLSSQTLTGTKTLASMTMKLAFAAAKRALSPGTSLTDLGLRDTKAQGDLEILLKYIGLRLLWTQDAEEATKVAETQAKFDAAVAVAAAAAVLAAAAQQDGGVAAARGGGAVAAVAQDSAAAAVRGTGPTPMLPGQRNQLALPPAKRLQYLTVPQPPPLSAEVQAIVDMVRTTEVVPSNLSADPLFSLLALVSPSLLSGAGPAPNHSLFCDAVMVLCDELGGNMPDQRETVEKAKALLDAGRRREHQYVAKYPNPPHTAVSATLLFMARITAAYNEAPGALLHLQFAVAMVAELSLSDCPSDFNKLDAYMRALAAAMCAEAARTGTAGAEAAALQDLYDLEGPTFMAAYESMIAKPRKLREMRAAATAARVGLLPPAAHAGAAPAAPFQAASTGGRGKGPSRSARGGFGPSGSFPQAAFPAAQHYSSGASVNPGPPLSWGQGSARGGGGASRSARGGDLPARGAHTAGFSQGAATNVCRDFNGERGCNRQVCRFPHVCAVCAPPSNHHARMNCPMK